MKKLFLIFIIISVNLYPQAGYVDVNNSVYNFLERMEALHIIKGYNSFELPKSRNEIASYLKEAILYSNQLDDADLKTLYDLQIEFEHELFSTLENSQSIIGNNPYNIFSDKEKYLFFYDDPGKANLFINLLAEGEGINLRDRINEKSSSTFHGKLGGEIRGTILNKFGFFLQGSQGQVFGDKQTALLRKEIGYNFKFNLQQEEGFYDETSGYLMADFDLLKFKLGRDRIKIGYGAVKSIIEDNAPMFDYLQMNINYKFFNFSFFHGKLLGNISNDNNRITGGSFIVEEKYIGYHRLSFNISHHFNFGAGEIIIYGNRPIDLSYLNPFTFYKSIEHSNQDRDNSMLFFDLTNNSIKGLKIFSTLLIDDIAFSKLGTEWWGNQTMFNAGIYSVNLYKILPIGLRLEYLRIDPYTFTHRLPRNNFTHSGYNLSTRIQPNTELFFMQINYRFNEELVLAVNYSYAVHGANYLNTDGSVIKNVGGDINLGHRTFDSETTSFLNGDLEYLRNVSALLTYQPFNQIFIMLNLIYINENLKTSLSRKETQSFLTFKMKF